MLYVHLLCPHCFDKGAARLSPCGKQILIRRADPSHNLCVSNFVRFITVRLFLYLFSQNFNYRKALVCYILDVNEENSVKDARQQTEDILGTEGLNVLINNAAVYLKCSAVQDIKVDEMIQSYRTNVVGPAIMCRVSLGSVFVSPAMDFSLVYKYLMEIFRCTFTPCHWSGTKYRSVTECR